MFFQTLFLLRFASYMTRCMHINRYTCTCIAIMREDSTVSIMVLIRRFHHWESNRALKLQNGFEITDNLIHRCNLLIELRVF